MKKRIDWVKLVIALAIPQLVGFIGSLFTTPSIDSWYSTLIRPSIAPPNWIFGPVWITLFVLMGISLYLIWNLGLNKKEVKFALVIFSIQLVLNMLWSIFFFGLHNPLLAFIEIIVLWVFILLMIVYFYRIKNVAGYLQIPYFLWVSFAAVLNLMFVLLNQF
ncbi:MAG: TspO/MBR family protein [archaeon]